MSGSRLVSSFGKGGKTWSAGWAVVLPLRLAFANPGKQFPDSTRSLRQQCLPLLLLAFLLSKYLPRSAPDSEYSHARNNA